MSEPVVVVEKAGAVSRVWLSRPDVHNAFNAEVISELSAALAEISADPECRVVVLGGRGRSFSAGADLAWMQSAAELSEAENRADAAKLATLLRRLERAPQATIARVQGTALGGGVGLIAACDLAIGVERAKLGFSEVRLGLIPAVISPHAIAKIGQGHARRLFVTGERFSAAHAHSIGLLSEVVADEEALDAAVEAVIAKILQNSPAAVASAKDLVRQVVRFPTADVDLYTAERIAATRATPDACEGMKAFLEKRPPSWAPAAEEEAPKAD